MNNSTFNRISKKALNNINSLDELIVKLNDKNDINKFKYRLEQFKEYLSDKLPDFTLNELLKIDNHFHILKEMYSWSNIDHLFIAIEYEQMQTSNKPSSKTLNIKSALLTLAKRNLKEDIQENQEYWNVVITEIQKTNDEQELMQFAEMDFGCETLTKLFRLLEESNPIPEGKLEVVVYTKLDYSENISIYVDKDLSRDEIAKQINNTFETWYYYDII